MDLLEHFQHVLHPLEFQRLIKTINYKKGSYIYIPPTKPAEMFQVQAGIIKIGSYTEEGQEICYDLLFRQEVFGNLRYLNGQFFEFSRALTDAKVITIDLAYYKKMIVHDPVISEWFNKTTIERWCRMETRLLKICTLSPHERIKSILNEFGSVVQDSYGRSIKVSDLLSISDISQMTGISRQTVSKLIKKEGSHLSLHNQFYHLGSKKNNV